MITKNLIQHLSGYYYLKKNETPGYLADITDLTGTTYNQKGWTAPSTDMYYAFPGAIFDTNLTTLDIPSQTDGNRAAGMFLGNGNTPTTSDSYKLDMPIAYSDSGLTRVGLVCYPKQNLNTIGTYVLTVKNNGQENITVSESAIIVQTGHIDKLKCLKFMIARDTFDPVILEPGQTRAFTMTIGLE